MSCNNNNIKPLRELYLYLTEECNLNCRHCWILPKYTGKSECVEHFLPLDLAKKTIDQAIDLGLVSVKLTGGEPLLHPQIKEIINYINKKGIALAIETNGVLLSEDIMVLIRENKRSFVSISLDSHIKEKHEKIRGVKDCFESTLNGIKLLCDNSINNQVIMSVLNENKDDIESLVLLADKYGVDSVKFNIIQPTEKGKDLHEQNVIPSVSDYIQIGRYVATELQKRTKAKLFFDLPPAFMSLSSMFAKDGNLCICNIDKILGVIWDGSVSFCGIGQNQQELVLGNIKKDTLSTIWENEILKPVKCSVVDNLKGICKKCLMKVQCKGKCLAQNYYRTKDLFSGFWFCEEAFKFGIFPESRITLTKE